MQLSVVIPIYNTEKYLEKCINSVINQNYSDMEIILVDDGSTDNSPSICDQYAKEFSFIKCIHSKNSGPATAKNLGLSAARGNYISFIDSDDELMPLMYQTLLPLANNHSADVICCSYKQVDEFGQWSHTLFTDKLHILHEEEAIERLLDKNLIYSQCWTKIYRRELLKQYKIRFIDGFMTEEDFIFNINAFSQSHTIVLLDRPFYIYTHRQSSLSRLYHRKKMEQFCDNMLFRLKSTEEIINTRFPSLKNNCIRHIISYLNLMMGHISPCQYKECKPYYTKALNYIRKKPMVLFSKHKECGFSLIGVFLIYLLPNKIYHYYRQNK